MFVYLDNSSTTRQYDEVTGQMVRMMEMDFGNPSSLHRMGLVAERKIKEAREKVAGSMAAKAEEIYFTGSGTESDNMAIFGAFGAAKRKGNTIITSRGEHSAVIEAFRRLETMGARVVYVGINSDGSVNVDQIKQSLDEAPDTILVSIMAVNNELGTVNDLKGIGKIVKSRGSILFHTDAIQAYGKIPMDIVEWKTDLVTVSGHKIHGPKGCGALYVKKDARIEPHIFGGGQEKGLRSGTENTPAIVGFGAASKIMHGNLNERIRVMAEMRSYLLEGIKAEIQDVRINSPEAVLSGGEAGTAGSVETAGKAGAALSSPGILNVSFLGCRGEVLLHSLEQRDIYVSTGAACSSKKGGSRILTAAGLAAPVIDSAIRFSFSEFNTIEQMDYVLVELKKAVSSMRKLTVKR